MVAVWEQKKKEEEVGGRCRASQSLLLPLFFFFLSGSRHTGGVAGTRDRGAAFSDNQQHGDTRGSEGMEKVTLMESDELLKKKVVAAADKKRWRKYEVRPRRPERGSGANERGEIDKRWQPVREINSRQAGDFGADAGGRHRRLECHFGLFMCSFVIASLMFCV